MVCVPDGTKTGSEVAECKAVEEGEGKSLNVRRGEWWDGEWSLMDGSA